MRLNQICRIADFQLIRSNAIGLDDIALNLPAHLQIFADDQIAHEQLRIQAVHVILPVRRGRAVGQQVFTQHSLRRFEIVRGEGDGIICDFQNLRLVVAGWKAVFADDRPAAVDAGGVDDHHLVIRVDHHIVRKVDRFILQLRQMVEIVFLLLKIEGGAQVFHRACRFGDGAADEIVEQRARVAELIAVAKGEGEGAAS